MEEQIIAVLREQETGVAVTDLCRKHGVSSATFYKLAKSGMVSLTEAPRRVLHVSPDLADHRSAPDAAAARTSGWRAEASGR